MAKKEIVEEKKTLSTQEQIEQQKQMQEKIVKYMLSKEPEIKNFMEKEVLPLINKIRGFNGEMDYNIRMSLALNIVNVLLDGGMIGQGDFFYGLDKLKFMRFKNEYDMAASLMPNKNKAIDRAIQ